MKWLHHIKLFIYSGSYKLSKAFFSNDRISLMQKGDTKTYLNGD